MPPQIMHRPFRLEGLCPFISWWASAKLDLLRTTTVHANRKVFKWPLHQLVGPSVTQFGLPSLLEAHAVPAGSDHNSIRVSTLCR